VPSSSLGNLSLLTKKLATLESVMTVDVDFNGIGLDQNNHCYTKQKCMSEPVAFEPLDNNSKINLD